MLQTIFALLLSVSAVLPMPIFAAVDAIKLASLMDKPGPQFIKGHVAFDAVAVLQTSEPASGKGAN